MHPTTPKLAVIGTGYLGAVHAASMTELGWQTIAADISEQAIASLSQGKPHFHEEGLEALVVSGLQSGNLSFTTDIAAAVAESNVIFVCVSTPQLPDSGAANTSYVESVVRLIAENAKAGTVIVGKSTVPVGTHEKLLSIISAHAKAEIDLIWNPEFLKEGTAVDDTLHPDRIIIGGGTARSNDLLRKVYARPISEGTPVVECDLATAELLKVAANTFLAMKISFINGISTLCEATGADAKVLADGIGFDARIGRKFLNAGLGYGGGCLPKDTKALAHVASEAGVDDFAALIDSVNAINDGQRIKAVELALEAVGGNGAGSTVGALGLAFKPLTDDVRESPSMDVVKRLGEVGFNVIGHDFYAVANALRAMPGSNFTESLDAALGADVVVVLTDWKQYAELEPSAHPGNGRTIIDTRGYLDIEAWQSAGWKIVSFGRGATFAESISFASEQRAVA